MDAASYHSINHAIVIAQPALLPGLAGKKAKL
jgi:hypothetical protein